MLHPHEVASLAYEVINDHNLQGWTFQLDRAKRRAGCCRHRSKIISLSSYFIHNNTREEILDVILHEAAHALAGHKAGHGPAWKRICVAIGARPERCYDSSAVTMPKGRYRAVCKGCGIVAYRHRRLKRGIQYHCTPCGPELGRLDFKSYVM